MESAHRKIIHIDMDAFYASVEQLDFPELKGNPIAVGGGEIRGVVSAASYEARKYGVKSAMSGALAKKNCPDLIFVKPRFDRYKEISRIIRSIFLEYTDLVEPLSLDEAFLDVTINKKNAQSATLLASEIREKIYERTGLTASAGISVNKFLAKIASDYNKPNGQKTINPDEISDFLDRLDVKRFFGIGKKTADKMYHLGIFTGADLKSKSLEFLETHFKNSGSHYYQISRGISNSIVIPDRLPKSLGAERTFENNITSEVFLEDKLRWIAQEVSLRLKRRDVSGKTITLKLKYSDFTLQTRSMSYPYFINDEAILFEEAKKLLYQNGLNNSVRLIGIQVSNLNIYKNKQPMYIQLRLDL